MTFKELIAEIAEKIRAKDGTTGKISPWDYPARIEAIPTGGGGDESGKALVDRSIEHFEDGEITTIGDHAFRDCKNLMTVQMTAVINVRTYAFAGCTSLEIVNMPAATTVTAYAFQGCKALKRIELPECRILARYAFLDSGLVKAILGGGGIGQYAFGDNVSLETVDIRGSGWSINPYAFYGCTGLKALILRDWTGNWSVPKENAFTGTPIEAGSGYIYVPKAMMTTLQRDAEWGERFWSVTRAIEDWPGITG